MGYIPAVLLAALALAASVATTPAQRCDAADVVVLAEVTGATSEPTPANRIRTRWDLAVLGVLKGTRPTTALTPGGTVAGLTLTISEAAPLQTDHRYLLFLRTRPDGDWVMGVDGAIAVQVGPDSPGADWTTLAPTLGRCAPR